MAEPNELNKKLAEWAGLEMEYAVWDGVFIGTKATDQYMMFIPKKKDGCDVWKPFTESLDACFKWLVPKLKGIRYGWNCGVGSDGIAFGVIYRIAPYSFYDTEGGSNPALALCLAIEKLIDGESNADK